MGSRHLCIVQHVELSAAIVVVRRRRDIMASAVSGMVGNSMLFEIEPRRPYWGHQGRVHRVTPVVSWQD